MFHIFNKTKQGNDNISIYISVIFKLQLLYLRLYEE